MSDCVIHITGTEYVPVRAIPAMTDDHFDALYITHLLGGNDEYAFVKSYFVEGAGLIETQLVAWNFYQKQQAILKKQGATYIDKINALPAGVVVSFEALSKVFFEMVIRPSQEEVGDDTYLYDPTFLAGLITRPILDRATHDLVMEGMQSATTATPSNPAAPAASEEVAQTNPAEQVPGVMPRTAIGKLAIKIAWEIELTTAKQATANQVIRRLEELIETETILLEKIPHGIRWMTTNSKEADFSLEACAKALSKWKLTRP